jgi:hypothetical protein
MRKSRCWTSKFFGTCSRAKGTKQSSVHFYMEFIRAVESIRQQLSSRVDILSTRRRPDNSDHDVTVPW